MRIDKLIIALVFIILILGDANLSYSQILNAKWQHLTVDNKYIDGKKEGYWLEEPDTIIDAYGRVTKNSVLGYFYCDFDTLNNIRVKKYSNYKNGINVGKFQHIAFDSIIVAEGYYNDGIISGYVLSRRYIILENGTIELIKYIYTPYNGGKLDGIQIVLSTNGNRIYNDLHFSTYSDNVWHGLSYDGQYYSMIRNRQEVKYWPLSLYKEGSIITIRKPFIKKRKEAKVRRYKYDSNGKISLLEPEKYSWFRRTFNVDKIYYPLKKIATGKISVDEANFR